MTLKGAVAGLRYRRSRRSDAAALARLMELGDAVGEGLPTPGVFRVFTERDFVALIESAMICVTAVRDVLVTNAGAAAATAGGNTEEVVAGFVAVDDRPPNHGPSGGADEQNVRESVRAWAAAYAAREKEAVGVTLSNSLWLRMLLAPSSTCISGSRTSASGGLNFTRRTESCYTTQEIAMDLLRVTLGSLSGIEHLFMSLGGPFACVDDFPGLSKLSSVASSSATATTTTGLRHLARAAVLPPLTMRQGRVEDYDDAVTLLVAGGPGMITELPSQFYLEELLQAQDAQHKVIVAEDSVTHAVVSLACVRQLGVEEQQYLARFYNTDTLERLKPLNVDGSDSVAAAAHGSPYQDGLTPSGTVSIFFLYFNPFYEHSAYQLLPHIFREFPTCDYAALQRPHSQTLPEPMVLERFQYMPLCRYQPHNARGEVVAPPHALWICPRVSLEAEIGMQSQVTLLTDPACAELRASVIAQFATPRAASPAGSGVHAVLHHQQQQQSRGSGASGSTSGVGTSGGYPGCSPELIKALHEDLEVSGSGGASEAGKRTSSTTSSNRAVFALSWGLPPSQSSTALASSTTSASTSSSPGRTVVGVLSVQPLSVDEMYALRANYDLDRFLSFNTAGGFDYAATDIALTADEGPLRYRSAALPGLAVRTAYIRPAFRHHLKFFLREVLRQTQTVVLLNLTSVDASLCQTALSSLTYVPPRRVVEVASTAQHNAAGVAADVHTGYTGTGASPSANEGKRLMTDGIPVVNDVTPALMSRPSTSATNSKVAKGMGERVDGKEAAAAASLALSSLFFTTRRLLSDERVRVHPRLVVVGASATALSLLYELFRVPYVDLLNVTLIATDGVPQHPNQLIGDSVALRSRQQQIWEADAMELLEREYMRLRLGEGFNAAASLSIGANVVRVVQGTLVDIDTNLKFVQLENGVYEPYDYLILATGRQYIVPPAIRALQQQEPRSARGGVIALSGVLAEDKLRRALTELNQTTATSIANVVVYGSGLDAIAALSTMISVGFPAQRLVLCRPQPNESASVREDGGGGAESTSASSGGAFADAACAEATLALLRVLGVTVLDGYGVSRLEFDDDVLSSVLLASLSFERKAGDAVELPCSLIVCLEDKDIDRNVLSALTKRSIVFDGRVIVGTTYETSQPGVLAAGPVAMFTRRYGATESFEAYSARDVGRDVAHVLLGRLGLEEFRREGESKTCGLSNPSDKEQADRGGVGGNPFNGTSASAAIAVQDTITNTTAGPASSQAATAHAPLPSYTSPVARRVRLPCHYQYFSAVRGATQFRPENCIRLDYSSSDMLAVSLDDVQTGTATAHDAGERPKTREMLIVYIHRRHRTIEGVVYLGNGAPPVHNYRALIGLPESLFHLEFRYNEVLEKARATAGSDTADVATASVGKGALTVLPRTQRLDLVAYLRLPLFHPLLCDDFAAFFAQLRRDTEAAEEMAAVRERVLRAAQSSGELTPAEAAAQVAELTDTRKALRYKVQLALLKYLHEGKDRRPQTMYLPSIEKQMAANRSAG
jgi:NADPH-dependent 2,4-dienoyl-CoA reductase/sulfur reductase-like enzyme